MNLIIKRPVIVGCVMTVLLFLLHQAAHAGRPMEIDDAGIVDQGTCQLEAWADTRRHSEGYWLMPACNIGGNLELSLGGGFQHEKHADHGKTISVQAKTVVIEGLAEHLDVAVSVGYDFHRIDGNAEREWTLNVPVTMALGSEQLLWHNNIGTVFEQEDEHWLLTWGTGLEYAATERVSLYAEIFGESGARPFYQLATGYWWFPEQLQVTFGFADSLEGSRDERWLTLGLNWVGWSF